MKRQQAAAICRAVPHFIKYKIGARKIPPPIPTSPAIKPMPPPIMGGMRGCCLFGDGFSFWISIWNNSRNPESKSVNPKRPIKRLSEISRL